MPGAGGMRKQRQAQMTKAAGRSAARCRPHALPHATRAHGRPRAHAHGRNAWTAGTDGVCRKRMLRVCLVFLVPTSQRHNVTTRHDTSM